MARILILYYSMYGHVETLAKAVAEGVQSVKGVEVTIKANVKKEGEILIPAKTLSALVAKLPEEEICLKLNLWETV